MHNFRVKMIRMKGDSLSEAYAAYCLPSWSDFDVELYDAITDETLYDSEVFWQYNFTCLASTIGMNESLANNNGWHGHSKREAAIWCNFIFLWQECVDADIPFLILEHDALLIDDPSKVIFEDHYPAKKISNHANVATFYRPEFCAQMLAELERRSTFEGPIATGPYDDLNQLYPDLNKHEFNLVVPVLDQERGTTIPEHYATHNGANHKIISLPPPVEDLKLM